MKIEIIPDQQTPVITSKISDVKLFVQENKELLDEFLHFVKYQFTAVGLAANQVEIDGERFMQRIFALLNRETKTWSLIFNPVITEYIGLKELKEEGCLTWVGRTIVAERNRAIKVSYYNVDGEKIENEFHKGFEAQIWQHEINHLNGVEERIENSYFELPYQKEYQRNDKCPCGSGLKYKKCCLLYL